MPRLLHAPKHFSNQGSVGRDRERTSSGADFAEHFGPSCKINQQTSGVGLVDRFSRLWSLCFCRACARLLVTSTSAHTDKLLSVLALLLRLCPSTFLSLWKLWCCCGEPARPAICHCIGFSKPASHCTGQRNVLDISRRS